MKVLSFSRAVNQLIMRVHTPKVEYKLALQEKLKKKMLTTLGARSFSAAAPKLWNELPVEPRQAKSLNSFKSRLKTYLFKKYFYSL